MGRLIVISNRIPTGSVPSGGLVVALHDCLTERGGVWIGSSDELKEHPDDKLTRIGDSPYTRLAYDLSPKEHKEFYLGFSNSVLWPLCHHRPDLIDLHEEHGETYLAVNRRVARMVAGVARPDDMIWVQDYHFLPLARELRAAGVRGRIGFFLHVPFPVPSNLMALPQVEDLADWLAAYDLVGLQTQRDVSTCLEFLRQSRRTERLQDGSILCGDRNFSVSSFPIGIDAAEFADFAARSDGADRLSLTDGTKLVIGVDRLDYSKGLVSRFQGFNAYLDSRGEDDPRATLLQIAPPSREDVEAYRDIRDELEQLAGSINGAHSHLDWTPIQYIRRPVLRERLAGLYRRAEAALVTPLADGMNLVAKEYVAAQDPADPGVLILSHFAGAAEQMTEALMVNPYDPQEMGRVIREALTMPLDERRRRHGLLWRNVSEQNVSWWTRNFLNRLEERLVFATAS